MFSSCALCSIKLSKSQLRRFIHTSHTTSESRNTNCAKINCKTTNLYMHSDSDCSSMHKSNFFSSSRWEKIETYWNSIYFIERCFGNERIGFVTFKTNHKEKSRKKILSKQNEFFLFESRKKLTFYSDRDRHYEETICCTFNHILEREREKKIRKRR